MTSNSHRQRVAVTGASGLLGRSLVPLLLARGYQVVAGVRSTEHQPAGIKTIELDLLSAISIERFAARANADWIIHTAAMTDVDRCEREPDLAHAVNAAATIHLTNAVTGSHTRFVYLSTDYVFDGADGPYDERAIPNPINVYGRTKLEGELAVRRAGSGHVIVRSASFLGVGAPGRPTFAEAMVSTILHSPPLLAAVNQRSNVTPVGFLAEAIVEIGESGISGVRHTAGESIISRYEFALMLARLLSAADASVKGVTYAELRRAAERPLNGGLTTLHTLKTRQVDLAVALQDWKRQIRLY